MASQSIPVANVPLSWTECLARHDQVLEEIERRRTRIVTAFQRHGVPYALIGGQAVAAWVASVDPDAVRTTKDVDVLLNRTDLPRAIKAAATAGFEFCEVMNVGMFLDLGDPRPKKAVHIVWTNEIVKPGETVLSPSMDEVSVLRDGLAVISLEALVRMKLTAWRRHDQAHIEDLRALGLVDASWLPKLPPQLAARLQEILDNPES